MSLLKRARPGYVWTWTEKMQEMFPERIAGQRCDYDGRYIYSVPTGWIDKGYVRQEVDRAQVDIFDLMGG